MCDSGTRALKALHHAGNRKSSPHYLTFVVTSMSYIVSNITLIRDLKITSRQIWLCPLNLKGEGQKEPGDSHKINPKQLKARKREKEVKKEGG